MQWGPAQRSRPAEPNDIFNSMTYQVTHPICLRKYSFVYDFECCTCVRAFITFEAQGCLIDARQKGVFG
jgi:hypothetical protein